jgi:hypothetical protein
MRERREENGGRNSGRVDGGSKMIKGSRREEARREKFSGQVW